MRASMKAQRAALWGLTELGLRPRTIRRGDQYLGRIVEIAEFLECQ
jgi:hypothetical protein